MSLVMLPVSLGINSHLLAHKVTVYIASYWSRSKMLEFCSVTKVSVVLVVISAMERRYRSSSCWGQERVVGT